MLGLGDPLNNPSSSTSQQVDWCIQGVALMNNSEVALLSQSRDAAHKQPVDVTLFCIREWLEKGLQLGWQEVKLRFTDKDLFQMISSNTLCNTKFAVLAPLPRLELNLTRALNALEGEREVLLEKQTKLMGNYQEFFAFFVQRSTVCVLMMAGGLFIGYYLYSKVHGYIITALAMNLVVEIVAYEEPTCHHQNANGAALYEKRDKLLRGELCRRCKISIRIA
ncbi:DNA replication licensing factor MCM3 [Striga asiatica]|uniref:DNA replication licensing factor MCM3 n=1 Tax=Striga asiatica TaxID=4170 RepID=A0A5A7Q4K7_STRAF|nr:DNA replication licensing factor MCM3 [Striga asiatica]